MQGKKRKKLKTTVPDWAQVDLLRAFQQLSIDQRVTLNSLMSELLFRASPELLKERQQAAKDPTRPFPKTVWISKMRKTRRGRRLTFIEMTERTSSPGWR